MLADEDGRPRCRATANALGVRLGVEMQADERGTVGPASGGLLVADSGKSLPPHLRPESLGGTSRLPVFLLYVDDLGDGLALRVVSEATLSETFIVPKEQVSFETYQAALAATRDKWVKVQ